MAPRLWSPLRQPKQNNAHQARRRPLVVMQFYTANLFSDPNDN
jgi:hypothetical protein